MLIKKRIKEADKISAWAEAVQIAGFDQAEANKLFGTPPPDLVQRLDIKLRPPADARAAFVDRFQQLASSVT